MAARRGKSQARRNGGSSGGLPGWAWMIIGVVLALGVVLAVPRLFKPDAEDGFFRPRPNPDAQPAAGALDEEAPAPLAEVPAPQPRPAQPQPQPAPAADYDFYTMLPDQEVPMTDAELAASARAETERRQRAEAQQRALQERHPDAADLAGGTTAPAPLPETPTPARTPATTPARPATPSTAATAPAAGSDARYLLQAGSFSASGDAEALKARIALLGLSARVESGQAQGKTVYRVRMGPYGSATELAEAKQKLGNGGLPALAIKAQ
ncbi:SPOR domain-containing protein [Luteimonas sp. FCS-9]|uniref:SPOR domain-containing protein n=1 Tax=Luteimonas sp. FCS-9 TaxID=1547516 RepID=UPI00063ECDBF|nr:SPOR domain-containing protein [Luteimonas sp. FCS-9]KLI99302.1 sporulation protein [Luteimonas sp. FCS-9]